MFALFISIGGFLLILSFLVIIHELGHFLAAKLFGVRVDEFGLGYPPRIKKLFDWRGTEFTLNWVPFGGFVRLLGETRDGETEEQTASSKTNIPVDSGVFYTKPAWQRVIILAAGAAVNFVFGIVAFSIMFTSMGIPEVQTLENGVLITQISQGSPAEESNIELGDVVTEFLADTGFVPITSSNEFIEQIKANAGSDMTLKILRGEPGEAKETIETQVYVRTQEEIPEGDGSIGIGIGDKTIEFVRYAWWQMPFRGAWVGMTSAFEFGMAIILGLGSMVGGMFAGTIPTEMAGPVGIASEVYKQEIFQGGIMTILNFAAIISINLAVVNLLPIPALDGGRIVVLFLEKLLGKAFKPVYEQYAVTAGALVLLSLIVLITIKDVGVILTDTGFSWSMIQGWLGG